MRRMVIMIVFLLLVGSIFIAGCQEVKINKKEEPKPREFVTKDHSDTLVEDNTNDNVATITLSEGDIVLAQLQILISADGDAYYEVTDFLPVPNNNPLIEWNTGESVIITEAIAHPLILDMNGNWATHDFNVRIIDKAENKIIHYAHVLIDVGSDIPLEPVQPSKGIFSTRDHSVSLTQEASDEEIAIVTLLEGSITISKLMILLSQDGTTYLELSPIETLPHNDPKDKWDAGEAVVISETNTPTGLLDGDGNWASQELVVKITEKSSGEVIFHDHIIVG